MNKIVLDSSAVLRLLLQEKGSESVARLLFSYSVLVSAVNYAEIVEKLNEHDVPSAEISSVMAGLGLVIVPFTEIHAFQCGLLKKRTKPFGLSLGDRACLALAITEKVPVYTADKIWAKLELETVSVHIL